MSGNTILKRRCQAAADRESYIYQFLSADDDTIVRKERGRAAAKYRRVMLQHRATSRRNRAMAYADHQLHAS